MYFSIEVQCEKCEEIYGVLVDKKDKDKPIECEECGGGMARRIWSVPNVSTEKTSASIPDGVAKGRFDGLKDQMMAKKELSKAKQAAGRDPSASNREELKRARAEVKKTGLDKS